MLAAEDGTNAAVRKASLPKDQATDGTDPQISAALRSAYEEAVREDVPAEFLDLLGKLS